MERLAGLANQRTANWRILLNASRTRNPTGTLRNTQYAARTRNIGSTEQVPPGSPLSQREYTIARQILKELHARLRFLTDVGLDYLSLDRMAATLSGGEAQRIRLATQIGSQLMGVLYILDEPSIGLHQRDNARLIRTLLDLRDLGNTVLVDRTRRRDDARRRLDRGSGAGRGRERRLCRLLGVRRASSCSAPIA